MKVAQDAATVDVRGESALPEVLAVLGTGPAPNAELAAARDLLARWSATGAHRRDRADDGFDDDLAVPLMDALFERLVRHVFTPHLGPYLAEGTRRPRTFDNPPSQTGGAFAHGWSSQLRHDLLRVLDREAAPPGVATNCGGGDLATCRQLLWTVSFTPPVRTPDRSPSSRCWSGSASSRGSPTPCRPGG